MYKILAETIVFLKEAVGELALMLMEAVIEIIVNAIIELF